MPAFPSNYTVALLLLAIMKWCIMAFLAIFCAGFGGGGGKSQSKLLKDMETEVVFPTTE